MKSLKIKIYRTIVLLVVVYGCETWSLTLKEEHRLRVFENRVLRIFGSKRDGVTEEWRKVHNEDLNDLYSGSGDKIEKNEMGGACSVHKGEERCILALWCGNLRERDHWGEPGVDWKIILRWIFRK